MPLIPASRLDLSFHQRLAGRWLATLSLSLAFGLSPNTAADDTALADSTPVVTRSLEELARTGQFDQLLAELRQEADEADPVLQSLIQDLERYERNTTQRDTERREAYDTAMADLREARDAGEIEDALVAAIDAHGLADDPDALLLEPEVVDLVETAERDADTAAAEGEWLTAVSIYRLLDLLYEVDARFSDRLENSVEHVRVLQMYAPEHFRKLSEARAEAIAEEDDEPLALPDPEPWEDRLDGINQDLLHQALRDSTRNHISSPTFAQMLHGAVEQLLVVVRTDAVVETFPGMADERARRRFAGFLQAMETELRQPGARLNWPETRTRIRQIQTNNDMTVQLPESVLYYELTEGATDTTDPFSYVIWPVDTAEFLERTMQGKFFGVGIQIARQNGELTVISPLVNTPAQRAGIRAGDVITMVDGRDTSSWSLTRAVREITGEEGTEVVLGIRRIGEDDDLQVTLVRAEIPIDSIHGWEHTEDGGWTYWIDEESGIGYIRVSQFIEQTVNDLDAAIAEMQEQRPVNGLVIDLRFNPGGLMEAAVGMSDRFVDEGPIVSTVNASGRRIEGSTREASSDATLQRFPIVVLINRGSASASEIVSGALQDYGRAVIIGERSYGKGSVQQVSWYPSRFNIQWGVKVTTSHYMLPAGRIIHREEDSETWGIEPDLVIPMTERQVADALEYRREVNVIREAGEEAVPAAGLLDDGLDPQLEAALVVLKTRILAEGLHLAAIEVEPETP